MWLFTQSQRLQAANMCWMWPFTQMDSVSDVFDICPSYFHVNWNILKVVPIHVIELFVFVRHHLSPYPWKKKLRLAYDVLNLLVASKPGVWLNPCFAEWQTGISDWKHNLNFGSLGLQGLVSSFLNLWKFPSQGFFPNPPSKIMVSLKWLFPISDFD